MKNVIVVSHGQLVGIVTSHQSPAHSVQVADAVSNTQVGSVLKAILSKSHQYTLNIALSQSDIVSEVIISIVGQQFQSHAQGSYSGHSGSEQGSHSQGS